MAEHGDENTRKPFKSEDVVSYWLIEIVISKMTLRWEWLRFLCSGL